jgi:hypothetical protein
MVGIIDGVFWGIALIGLGVWFLVRRYVPVHIPVIRIVVALFFVYLGVRVLVNGPVVRDRNTVVFSDSSIQYAPAGGRAYNVIFSNSSVDLSDVQVSGSTVRTEVNVVFGSGTLRINPSSPVRVQMSSAFGTVDAPSGRSVAFGDSVYTTDSYREGAPALEIHATAVFGRLVIQN